MGAISRDIATGQFIGPPSMEQMLRPMHPRGTSISASEIQRYKSLVPSLVERIVNQGQILESDFDEIQIPKDKYYDQNQQCKDQRPLHRLRAVWLTLPAFRDYRKKIAKKREEEIIIKKTKSKKIKNGNSR